MDINVLNEAMTDEAEYQMLRNDKSGMFMDADEWKALRLKKLSEEGRLWSE